MASANSMVVKIAVEKALLDLIPKRMEALGIKNPNSVKWRKEEIAMAAGAAAALHAAFGPSKGGMLSDYVPPVLILAPMCGRSLYGELKDNAASNVRGV